MNKYQIILQYQKAEESGVTSTTGADDMFVHEGKQYRRVEIEGKNEDYLMDEEGNIYDMALQ